MMVDVEGMPLVARTVLQVAPEVDECVLAARSDLIPALPELEPHCRIVVGGPSRTASEAAGLAAVSPDADLIGFHDAARPWVDAELIRKLFAAAAEVGAAVPILRPPRPLLDLSAMTIRDNLVLVQTPQVFAAGIARAGFEAATAAGAAGYDTYEIVNRFSPTSAAAVPGVIGNRKVTFPADLPA